VSWLSDAKKDLYGDEARMKEGVALLRDAYKKVSPIINQHMKDIKKQLGFDSFSPRDIEWEPTPPGIDFCEKLAIPPVMDGKTFNRGGGRVTNQSPAYIWTIEVKDKRKQFVARMWLQLRIRSNRRVYLAHSSTSLSDDEVTFIDPNGGTVRLDIQDLLQAKIQGLIPDIRDKLL